MTVPVQRLVVDFGHPEGNSAGWKLKFDVMRGEPTIYIALHWNDKQASTHAWAIDATDMREALDFALGERKEN